MCGGFKKLSKPLVVTRLCVGVFGLLCLGFSGSWCGYNWLMLDEAKAYMREQESMGYRFDVNAYDTCGLSSPGDFDTNWTFMFAINGIVYLVLSVCTVILFIGSFVPPLLSCGFIGLIIG